MESKGVQGGRAGPRIFLGFSHVSVRACLPPYPTRSLLFSLIPQVCDVFQKRSLPQDRHCPIVEISHAAADTWTSSDPASSGKTSPAASGQKETCPPVISLLLDLPPTLDSQAHITWLGRWWFTCRSFLLGYHYRDRGLIPSFHVSSTPRRACYMPRVLVCLWLSRSVMPDCDHIGGSPLGSSVHGIFQARILVWVAISFSRGSSWPKDPTCVSCLSREILYCWVTWEVETRITLNYLVFVFSLPTCQASTMDPYLNSNRIKAFQVSLSEY